MTNPERRRRRLNLGVARLARWAGTASQVEKNAVYEALFAVSDGSVFRTHTVLDDVQRTGEFFVLVRESLVLKVSMHPFNTFGILYIGPQDVVQDEPTPPAETPPPTMPDKTLPRDEGSRDAPAETPDHRRAPK